MNRTLKYTFYDLIRSWWCYAYFGFYFLTAGAILYLSGDANRAVASLMNIIIILSPLVGTLFATMYYYNSREFMELLLAQPVRRRSIFLGQYLGLAGSLSLSFLLGLIIPFIVLGFFGSEFGNFLMLSITGVLLTFIFSAIAYWIAIRHENRIVGFGIAIFTWLFLAVIYDGIFLLILILFEDYPLDKLTLGLTMLNPIDLSRILLMLKLDISALMGYTGAVFQKFFGTNAGITIAFGASALWILIPVMSFLRKAARKDF